MSFQSIDVSNGITITDLGSTFTKSPTDIRAYLTNQPPGLPQVQQEAATLQLENDIEAFVQDGWIATATVDWTTGNVNVSLTV